MIIGVGIDIVDVKRMEKWLLNEGLLNKYFHADEIDYIKSRGRGGAQSLAARFAAKEAFTKAIGTGFVNINLKEIKVIRNKNGMPHLQVSGTAKEAFERSGADKMHISLTHEKDSAAAVVVLESV